MNNKLKAQVMGAFFEFLKLDERFWDSDRFSHNYHLTGDEYGNLISFCEHSVMRFSVTDLDDGLMFVDSNYTIITIRSQSDIDHFASKLNQFYQEFLEREDGKK